jgi:hypothetical protein
MSTLVCATAQCTTLSDGTNTTSSTNAIMGSAKAWVNFNGTTSSPSTIRGSFNVSSVTKNGTGDYTVNFTTALADANYATVAMGNGGPSDGCSSYAPYLYNNSSRTASVVRILCHENGGAVIDVLAVSVAIFR